MAVVHMPPNIFANTGTNVSILFLDKMKTSETAVLVDASKLGTKVKEGKNQKTLLSSEDEERIIETINSAEIIEDFSAVVNMGQIKEKSFSFNAGQFFETKVEHIEMSPEAFRSSIGEYKTRLNKLFSEGQKLEVEITENFDRIIYG